MMNITDLGHLISDAATGEDRMEKASQRTEKSTREIADLLGRYKQLGYTITPPKQKEEK